jgi:hypothetical protein
MKIERIIVIPAVVIALVILLINSPDLVGAPLLTWSEKTNVILTTVLATFAVIEGYSTYVKLKMEKKRYAVNSASDELEKAYGPIYTVLSKPAKQGESTIYLQVSEKLIMDEKLSTYRCMFPANITDYWENNIRKLEPSLSTDVLASARSLMNGHFSYAMVDAYKIPLEFVDLFTTEYVKRTETLRKLLTE